MKNRFRKVAKPFSKEALDPRQPVLTPPGSQYENPLLPEGYSNPFTTPQPSVVAQEGVKEPDQGFQWGNLPWGTIGAGGLAGGSLGGLIGGRKGAIAGALLGALGGYGLDQYSQSQA